MTYDYGYGNDYRDTLIRQSTCFFCGERITDIDFECEDVQEAAGEVAHRHCEAEYADEMEQYGDYLESTRGAAYTGGGYA